MCELRKRTAGRQGIFTHPLHCYEADDTVHTHSVEETKTPTVTQTAHGRAGFSGSSVLILRARQCSFSLEKAVGTEVEAARIELWGYHSMKGDVKTKTLN